jgi:hypothetical protein
MERLADLRQRLALLEAHDPARMIDAVAVPADEGCA